MYSLGVGGVGMPVEMLSGSLLGLPVLCDQRDNSSGRGIGYGHIIYLMGFGIRPEELDGVFCHGAKQ